MSVTTIPRPPPATHPTSPQIDIPPASDTNAFPALPPSMNLSRVGNPTTCRLQKMCLANASRPDILGRVETYANVFQTGKVNTSHAHLLYANVRYARILYAYTHGFFHFRCLPLELREKVYEFAIKSERGRPRHLTATINIDQYFLSSWPVYLPSVCKAIPEAMPVWVRDTIFKFKRPFVRHTVRHTMPTRFLETMRPIERGLESIRVIYFHGVDSWRLMSNGLMEDGSHMDLIKHCPGLRTVAFWNWEYTSSAEEKNSPLAEQDTGNEIVSAFAFEELFHCRNLREFFINCNVPSHPSVLLKDAMDWMRTEFKRRNNQTVRIYAMRRGEEVTDS